MLQFILLEVGRQVIMHGDASALGMDGITGQAQCAGGVQPIQSPVNHHACFIKMRRLLRRFGAGCRLNCVYQKSPGVQMRLA